MSGTQVQRSLRRMTALLLVPLAFLVIEFGIRLRKQHGIVQGLESQVISVSQTVSVLFIIGAVVYLGLSAVGSLRPTADN